VQHTHPRTLIDKMKCSSCCSVLLVDAADSWCKPMPKCHVPPPRRVQNSRPDAVLRKLCRAINLARVSKTSTCFREKSLAGLPSRKPFHPYMLQGGCLKQRKTRPQYREQITLTRSHMCSFARLLCCHPGTYRRRSGMKTTTGFERQIRAC
jgi:hypothetical protein